MTYFPALKGGDSQVAITPLAKTNTLSIIINKPSPQSGKMAVKNGVGREAHPVVLYCRSIKIVMIYILLLVNIVVAALLRTTLSA